MGRLRSLQTVHHVGGTKWAVEPRTETVLISSNIFPTDAGVQMLRLKEGIGDETGRIYVPLIKTLRHFEHPFVLEKVLAEGVEILAQYRKEKAAATNSGSSDHKEESSNESHDR